MSLGTIQTMSRSNINSTVETQHVIRPKTHGGKKSPFVGLTLTSLVDCFTILVVYLLVATSIGAEEIEVPSGLKLPQASSSDPAESGLIVRAQDGKYYVENAAIAAGDLADILAELKKTRQTEVVIIQADRKENFEKLNPAVLSILQAGFEKVRFAVIQEDES